MATLQLTYSDLYTRVSNFLGLTTTGTAPTGTDLTTCQDIVARGYRQFLYPIDMRDGTIHQWNFLKKAASFSTVDGQWKYALPTDFSDFCKLQDGSIIHYDSNEIEPALCQRSADQILELRTDIVSSEPPYYFAVTPAAYDIKIGTSYELWLYPNPDQAYILNYFYRFDPLKPSATSDVTVGGIRACEAILESCLAVAETQEEDGSSKVHQEEAKRLVQILIIADTITDSDMIGNLYNNENTRWPPIRPYLIPYDVANNVYS